MPTFEITEPIMPRTPAWQRLWLLVCTGLFVTGAQIYFLVDHHSAKDIIVTIVAGSFLIWGAAYLWRLEEQPLIHFVEVTPDGIRIKDTQIYNVFLPWSKVKVVSVKERITFKDSLRDSFSWDGRSLIKGQHVIVVSRRIVMGAGPLAFLPTKVFRFKVEDPYALVELAREYKERYRGMPG